MKTLSPEVALDILQRRPDARLVQTKSASGSEYSVSPDGGRVRPADAREIIQRREIVVADAGLFSDTPKSWRFRHA